MGRRSVNQPELFDVTRTVPTACPVGNCQAIRLPGQHQVSTCAHDLEPEHRRRPNGCLNTIDNRHSVWPEGY